MRVDLPADPTHPAHPTHPTDRTQEDPVSAPETTAPAPPAAAPVHTPPVFDSFFGAFWPDRVPGRRAVVGAAAATGLLAALVLPFRDLGLGWALVLFACGGTVLLASPHLREPFTLACGVLAGLLVLPVVLLDAEWIATLCVLAGAAVLLIGVTRGRTVPGFVLAGIAWPLASLRGLPWLGRTLQGLGRWGRVPALARTAAWSVLAVLVFGLLVVSADALVASWVGAVLPDWDPASFVLRAFVAGAVFAVVLAAAYVALNPPRVELYRGRETVPGAAPLRVARPGGAGRRRARTSSWRPRRRWCSAATTTSSGPPG